VIEQRWTHVTANKKDTLPLRNIYARFNVSATRRILYISHWDSKPHADQSFADDDKKRPVPGADDGASSTAMLMELAEILKRAPTTVGVDLLFTDGEDYGTFNPDVDVLLGAQYFADHPLPDSTYRPTFGVLFDMIGDKDLKIYKETNSQQAAPDVNDRVWKMAAALGYSAYFSPEFLEVGDDHLPLIKKGFRVIDVIDINYDAWHKVTDTMDKISAQSLEIVGRVALAMIRSEEKEK
jgi:Zn-dependent M28 family amino/carboxypeptidase